jgi:hypothetical protein
MCSIYGVTTVPVLSVGDTLRTWLNGRSIVDASTHTSKLIDKVEEGIVIKPMIEQNSFSLGGRLFLKKRSPVYLLTSDL